MVPRAGVGVVFGVVESVIGAKFETLLGFEQRHAVDAAAACWNMFFEPPTQAAKEIKLAVQIVVPFILACQCVVAGFVEMGVFEADRVGVVPQVARIEIDHIGHDRVAPFSGMPRDQFRHVAVFAKRVEQVFSVIAVIHPNAWRGLDHSVDGGLEHFVCVGVMCDADNLFFQIGGNIDLIGDKCDDRFEPCHQVMAQGRVDLDPVLDKDHRDRPFGEGFAVVGQERT